MKIKPYPQNAKVHPDKQLKQIAKSIKEFGWQQSLVVDRDGVIIVGHGRWFAYEKYKDEMDLPKPEIKIARTLTKEQVKAYRLADNKLNESDWDMELAIEELKSLNDEMFELTGFDKDLLIELDEKDDIIPENPPPMAKLGQIWQLGKHRVMCGDSTIKENVEKLMDGKKVDMVFTDPPYNVDYSGRGKETNKKIKNDNQTEQAFRLFLEKAFDNYRQILKLRGGVYICYASRTHREFEDALNKANFEVKNQIIWVKLVASMGWGDYRWKHEPIFYCHQKGKETDFYGDRKQYTEWREEKSDSELLKFVKKYLERLEDGNSTIWRFGREFNYKHPTQKPVQMILKAIFNSSKRDDIILDTFLGSDSTLIACEKTNRICYGMEIDEHYCDVIIQRYKDYTGIEPLKLN